MTGSITFYACENSASNRATAAQVRSNMENAKSVITENGGDWAIFGLADGMKINGKGYYWLIETGYGFGQSLCVSQAAPTTPGINFSVK